MTAKEILQQLHAMGKGWVDPESTVDRITHGPADREVMKAAVTWMGTTRAIRKAAEQECAPRSNRSTTTSYNHLDRSFLDIEFTYIHEAAPYTMVGPGGA